ncbi:glycosyltransferase family 15 protein NDAI_0A08900 [Naumovozyma dairenensis CBS 421]|uniref:Glycosyltransferase family 15 protein n=1 Tax=Naumovozyma dairenensis (strain ATCC 10597 / BCRC 20456 / CBS 421 / NBRC 0211 / NRRL Y-12639) TaxID=1071378 RepID=G0W5F4_NAUDC|nr:hypothetical protein NDAI_0A08900 [Naumovozyma dairenensis CBS 421]CCD23042.1 hypothetical protein NDAI_0A08900 [Naumovozyma dairenensis CBS 421]
MGKVTFRSLNGKAAKRIAAVALVTTLFVIILNISSTFNKQSSSQSYELKENSLIYTKLKQEPYHGEKPKATFVTLARNKDLSSLLDSIKSMEDRFNHKFQYDWVFLNDDEFTEEFINATSIIVSGTAKYGRIPKEHWSFPEWIDQDKAAAVRKKMKEDKIIYGDSISYRHMCRFESGFFYRHPLLKEYDWYWRVEPQVKFFCDIDYDVFKFMQDNNKKYGFSISMKEYMQTIPTLWDTTKKFLAKNPEFIHPNNMLDFISDDNGESFNRCHFWSNFEIASLDLWRSEAYSKYFKALDEAGGFFYERWGDAPIHSMAAALFLDRDEIHHFGEMGYYHPPYTACPIELDTRVKNKCYCKPEKDFTWQDYSCTLKFYNVNRLKKPQGWAQFSEDEE